MKKIIHTDSAPAAVGPYSQAVRVGEFLYVSGQIGLDPATGKMVEGGLARQVEQVLDNLRSILEAAGGGVESVVKTTVLLQSMDDFGAMNEIYAGVFKDNPPARAAFEVAALPLGALVEIEAVAFLG